jgi:acyl-CoA synthetase (AMP-forming)/AMP-acid ligase II
MAAETDISPDMPPPQARISDYVSWFAEQTPDAEAMVLEGVRTSYAQLRDRVDALARALLAAGVRKGDRVATLATPSPEYFESFLATASIGAIWLGLNPRYQLEELCYAAGDSEPSILLTRAVIGGRDYSAEITALRERTPALSSVVVFERDAEHAPGFAVPYREFIADGQRCSDAALESARMECGGRDPCMIVYTSGSTGRPKGALLHHEGIVAFSREQNRVWPVSPMRALNYFPINHIGCVVDLSCPTLVVGGSIVFLEDFSPRRSLELMEQERITLWGSVPSTFQLQFAEPDFESFDLSAVQMIVWGGAAMPRELITRLLDFDRPLATNYGMTESGSAITVIPPTRDTDLLAGTVGWPFPGTEVRLVDKEGEPVADGEAGEIRSRSIYNMLGYWRRPDATAETLTTDGWLATGDLGRRNPDGSYSIVGRVKEMYKSGGYNVYPREVEQVIESHPAVDMAAVVSTEDPVWQEVGVAYVLPRREVSMEELRAWCRERLANYKLPKLFVIVEQLPLLPIGKVDKVTLTRRAERDYQR